MTTYVFTPLISNSLNPLVYTPGDIGIHRELPKYPLSFWNQKKGCDLFLMSLKDNEEIPERILVTARYTNTPILYTKKGDFFLYGYMDGQWGSRNITTTTGGTTVFGFNLKSLPFPFPPSNHRKVTRSPSELAQPLVNTLKEYHTTWYKGKYCSISEIEQIQKELREKAYRHFPTLPNAVINELIHALMFKEPIGEHGIMPMPESVAAFPLVYVLHEGKAYFLYQGDTNKAFNFLQREIIQIEAKITAKFEEEARKRNTQGEVNRIYQAVKNNSFFLFAYNKSKEHFPSNKPRTIIEEEFAFNVTSSADLISEINSGNHRYLHEDIEPRGKTTKTP